VTDDSGREGRRDLSPYIVVGSAIGAYRIEAYLDRGGMASVYEATDLRLNRHVALKVLARELTEGSDFRERFMRESRFAASLDHPNIVPIYEAGEAEGLLYIAMRYVRGGNLSELLRREGPLDPRRALAILSPVADALDTAHAAGLVHRDVKPANILLAPPAGREGHEHVYLTDFGLTKHMSALTKLTAAGNFVGTMAYISPEQIRGEPLDARTDQYAFGCVAYQCLTGVPPFVKDDQAALMWAHLNDPPKPVSDYRPELRAADPIFIKALAKKPSDRYQTCGQFIEALSEAVQTARHGKSSQLTVEGGFVSAVSAVHDQPSGPVGSGSKIEDGGPLTPGAGRVPDADRAPEPVGVPDSAPVTEGTRDDDTRPGRVPEAAPVRDDDTGPAYPRPGRVPEADPVRDDDTGPAGPGPSVGDSRPATTGPDQQTAGLDSVPVGSVPRVDADHPATSRPNLHAAPLPQPPGPSSTRSSRRSRSRTVIVVAAAVVVVAASLTAVLVVRPLTRLESGQAQAVDSATSSVGSLVPEPTAAAEPTSGSAPSDGPSGSAGNPVAPPGTSAAVVPEPAVAIPTIDGPPVAVGATPGFVAIAPDGRYAYIANRAAGVVTVLDLTINKVIATIRIPAGPPQFIAFAPDGNHAYVSIYNDPKTINMVAVLDTRTTRLLQTIPVQQKPYALAVTPDQRFVYVPSHDAGAIDIIDVGTNTVVDSVDVLPNPHWVTFSPDGKLAYIANHESNVLSVLDTGSRKVIKTIRVGTSPHSVAVSPDGKQVAVVCFDSNDAYFVDTATTKILGTVAVGTNPQDITYSPDGRYVYTANVESNTVSVIDTETRTLTATIPTDSPTSVAVSPNGSRAYVTNLDSGTVTILKTS